MQNAEKTKKKRNRSWLWILLGVIVLLYPIVATLWNDHLLQRQADEYSSNVQNIHPNGEIDRLLADAHAYNSWLAQTGHHAMPPEPSSPGYDRYMSTLKNSSTGDTIARISIDSIGVDLPVSHTTHPDVLYHGAGHMFGSDLPVGGLGTNAVISAHTGMVNASMFDRLPAVKDGAVVKIQVLGQTNYYKVTGRKVVKPNDWQDVTYEPNRDKLTLVTCTPYGINSDRLLVVADRIDPSEATSVAGVHWPLSWWMILDLLILLIAGILLFIVEKRRRDKKKAQESEAAELAG
ncbi:class C sortase [Corynebacterium epidermidicanis]|uniref:Sortase family protein, LPXTG-site transpeptidase n=1 Tax=Corynebacterium epidermidicanis TaxID=1050174 RepID=A0A0G3GYI2_9CORY|nr:class C sortase [Corynebacterium epidermidicanis]AKK03917.1 sortase family protein, LPXTG-site transpeptidase [Corynebacterium epidermidicanis]